MRFFHSKLWCLIGFSALIAFTLSFIAIPTPASTIANAAADETCTPALEEWERAPNAPAFHLEGATATVNGKLYIFSGFADATLTPSHRVDVFNPATRIWESRLHPRAPMPFAASHVQAAVHGQYVWLAGGFRGQHPGQPMRAVWRYDTVTDTWMRGPKLPERRAGGGLVVQGPRLHYFGGLSVDRNTDQASHWVLNLRNPNAQWRALPDLAMPRNHLNGVALNGLVYAVGGQFNHDRSPKDVALVHAYDRKTQTWSQLADLPTPRSHFEQAIFTMHGKIIVIGGRNNQGGERGIARVTLYDPASNQWSELRPLPVPLLAPVATYIDDYIIVTNGGADYNQPRRQTYMAKVTWTCSASPNTEAGISS